MAAKNAVYALLLSAALCTPAAAQKANTQSSSNATVTTTKHAGEWRSSKMIGLNVYNPQNEKIGDISEILIDQGGKVVGYVLGVGGFLGMGQHDVLVQPGQLKFVMEPVRTSNTGSGTTNNNAAANRNATTGTAADNANARESRSANEQWYPDHAVMNATKDQLKGMPEFKYQ
jgi:PRC-barrel domain